MKKDFAISIFGSGASLARAIGLGKSAISMWPNELTTRQQDEVIGAAIRLGKITPEQVNELVKNDERQRNERSAGDAH